MTRRPCRLPRPRRRARGRLTLRERLLAMHRRRLAREREAAAAAAAWRRWVPGPRDRPGPYEPTIVCWHGTPSDRGVASSIATTTDTPEHRTPTWWAARMPGVALELVYYPHGFLGRPTRRHNTRHHVVLGRYGLGVSLPDHPLGLPRPAAAVVVVTTPWGATTATWTGREDARGRPVYAISPPSWADLQKRKP